MCKGSGVILKKLKIILILVIIIGGFQTMSMVSSADNVNPPSSLYLTVLNSTQIKLDWTDTLLNESGYRVYKRIDSGSFALASALPANTITYTDTVSGDTTGHTYTYMIQSADASSNLTIHTNEASTTFTSVAIPDSLTANPVSNSQIDLKWTYPESKSYASVIERRPSGGSWGVLARLDSGVNSYSDTGLLSNSIYFYRVRSVVGSFVQSTPFPNDGIGRSATTMLNLPVNLYGYVNITGQVNLTWNYDTAVTSFVVERKKRDEVNYAVAATLYNNNFFYLDSGVTANIWYVYRVKAVIGNNSSPYSEEFLINATYLEEPSVLTAVSTPEGEIKLNWIDNSSKETGFEIWKKKSGSLQWENYASVGQNVTTYTDKAVLDGSAYNYKIRSKIIYSGIYSSFSKEATSWVTILHAPTDLDFTVLTSSIIILTWADNSNNESGFKVERKEGIDGNWVERAILPVNQTSFTDNSIVENTQYFYRVKVFENVFYNSFSYSDEIEVITSIPLSPPNLTSEALSSTQIRLRWKDSSANEDGFRIERRSYYSSVFVEVARVSADKMSYIDKNLWQNTQYYYRVSAYNKTGYSSLSNEASSQTRKEISYPDISSNYWARAEIANLSSRGVFTIKSGGKFNPSQSITRGEFISILIKAFKLNKTVAGSFADVNSNHKYYKQIMIAYKMGIISPNKANYIYPDNYISREEMVVLLVKTLKAIDKSLPAHDVSILDEYPDVSMVSKGNLSYFSAVFGEKLMNGVTKNGIRIIAPKAGLTRAQAAIVVCRALNVSEE